MDFHKSPSELSDARRFVVFVVFLAGQCLIWLSQYSTYGIMLTSTRLIGYCALKFVIDNVYQTFEWTNFALFNLEEVTYLHVPRIHTCGPTWWAK